MQAGPVAKVQPCGMHAGLLAMALLYVARMQDAD